MTAPEADARDDIDKLLLSAGWQIQNVDILNLGAGWGVAVREFRLREGIVDYMLFIRRRAIGVIEAKSRGATLSGVVEQSERYACGIQENRKNGKRNRCSYGFENIRFI